MEITQEVNNDEEMGIVNNTMHFKKENTIEKIKNKCSSKAIILLLLIIVIIYYSVLFIKFFENENPERRQLRSIGHSHQKTCEERERSRFYRDCCHEDIKCWENDIHSYPLWNDRVNLKGEHIYEYSSNEYQDCSNNINYERHHIFNDFNQYKGGNLSIKINYHYYNVYEVNITKCEESEYGCCTIKNHCENKEFTIAKFKESNDPKTDGCPSIINLWQETEKWKRSGYPDEDNSIVVIVTTIIIIIVLIGNL